MATASSQISAGRDYDVVVVGGGPTGAIASLILARANLRVAVFERTTAFPMRVGESLLPRSYDVLHELGLVERMATVPHTIKYGAKFGFAHEEDLTRVAFADGFRDGATMTFNVERAAFDEMLLKAAQDAGAKLHRGVVAHLSGPPKDGDVKLTVDGKQITASYLIDASGRATLVGRELNLRKAMPDMRKLACFAHYTGVERDPGQLGGDLLGLMCEEGWFWLIPIDPARTSIGFVVDVAAEQQIGMTHEQLLEWAIMRAPQVARRCVNAKRVTPVHFVADFSYTCKPYAGPGYFLAGDSGAFIDPVFSTGVCLGMSTGKYAAEAVIAVLQGKMSPHEAKRGYINMFETASNVFFRMVRAWYKHPFREVLRYSRNTGRVRRAIVAILAGQIFPTPISMKIRWRLWVMELAVRLQRFIAVVPRRSSYSLRAGAAIAATRIRFSGMIARL